MSTRRRSLLAAALVTVAITGCSAAEGEGDGPPSAPAASRATTSTPIVFDLDGTQVEGQLDDSAASRSLLAQLPLTVTFNDYGGQEIIGALPQPLDLDGAPDGSAAPALTIGYYVPQQSLVLYYESVGYFGGIVPLGTFEGSDAVEGLVGEVDVTIRIAR